MIIRKLTSFTLFVTAILTADVIAKDIAVYRWVDENNIVHFSQHLPQDSKFSHLTTITSYQAKEKSLSEKYNSASIIEQLAQFERDQAEVVAKNKIISQRNCEAARLNNTILTSSDRIMITAPDGKSRELSPKERSVQLELTIKQINMFCDETNLKAL